MCVFKHDFMSVFAWNFEQRGVFYCAAVIGTTVMLALALASCTYM